MIKKEKKKFFFFIIINYQLYIYINIKSKKLNKIK